MFGRIVLTHLAREFILPSSGFKIETDGAYAPFADRGDRRFASPRVHQGRLAEPKPFAVGDHLVDVIGRGHSTDNLVLRVIQGGWAAEVVKNYDVGSRDRRVATVEQRESVLRSDVASGKAAPDPRDYKVLPYVRH